MDLSEIIEEKEVKITRGVVLELISNERFQKTDNNKTEKEAESSVIGHILRTENYGKEINSEPWVIHFVTVIKFPELNDIKWYEKSE